jgi:anti-sigma-K factor RskA
MTSDEMYELLGAYALDAVEPDERAEIEQLLSVDPRAAAEVREHREVATMLAFSGTRAPEQVWDRIAASLGERAPAPAPGPELAKVIPMAERRSRKVRRAVVAAVAVAAALLVGIIGANIADRGSKDPLEASVAQARDGRGTLTYSLAPTSGTGRPVEALVDDKGHGYLLGDSLPTIARDRTYQLWGVMNNGKVISLGVLGSGPETAQFTIDGDLAKLAITEEIAGGVAVSTNTPLYVGDPNR